MGKKEKKFLAAAPRAAFLVFCLLLLCLIASNLFAQTPDYTRRTHPGSTQPEHLYGYRPYGDDRNGMLVGGLRRDASVLPNIPNQYDERKEGEPLPPHSLELPAILKGPEFWKSPEGMVSTLQIMLVLTVLTLAPAIVIMTTSFVRIVVVLSILRQALGTGQLPPSQVITALSLFITLLLMAPSWQKVYREAVLPYTERRISLDEAFTKAEQPIRRFMCSQIEKTGNFDDIFLFMRYVKDAPAPKYWQDVPWRALLPAFMLSELKTAFLIGFMIFLPFLILDMIIASVMVSMGMMMLPPVMISLPFKLMLFVLMDGWNLVVMALMESFAL
ncbi:MAG: flagellar type III secretion system pore protein FliP [Planctomycetaceae bacterium]|nr:flagellar type III secretion system pore protein FliP [Planctomycetaceae bacterium]